LAEEERGTEGKLVVVQGHRCVEKWWRHLSLRERERKRDRRVPKGELERKEGGERLFSSRKEFKERHQFYEETER